MVIRGYAVGPLLKKTVREIGDDGVPGMAASTAYAFFFSLFPLFLFLAPLASLVGDRERLLAFLTSQLATVLPGDQLAVVGGVLRHLVMAESAPALLSTGLVLAAWSGSSIFGSLTGALNVAYDVSETRPWWQRQLTRLGMFVAASMIVLFTCVILVGGGTAVEWLAGAVGLGAVPQLWSAIQIPLAMASLWLLAFTILRVLPDVRQRWGHAAAGATLTTVAWLVATLLFRLYVHHFPPNPAYGFIGGVIVLLGWMYYSMFALLAGGELASELHHGSAALEPKPGAIYLGRVVTHGGPGTASTERIEGR